MHRACGRVKSTTCLLLLNPEQEMTYFESRFFAVFFTFEQLHFSLKLIIEDPQLNNEKLQLGHHQSRFPG